MDAAEQVFGKLAGEWALIRAIEPALGSATGKARFSESGPGRLHYREDVELRLSTGYVGEGYREYDYVLEGDRIRVLLTDGTTMHLLDFTATYDSALTAADIHDCRADQYRGTYRLDERGVLTVEMKVDGPAKDYRIVTEYQRA